MDNSKKKKKHHKSNLNFDAPSMEVEFGSEWNGEAKRAAEKVETRVKTTAAKYGFFEENE